MQEPCQRRPTPKTQGNQTAETGDGREWTDFSPKGRSSCLICARHKGTDRLFHFAIAVAARPELSAGMDVAHPESADQAGEVINTASPRDRLIAAIRQKIALS